MIGPCGLTGCDNPAAVKCCWCSLPLCAEHAVPLEIRDGRKTCCRDCAAYLRAKSSDSETKATGEDHAG